MTTTLLSQWSTKAEPEVHAPFIDTYALKRDAA